MLVHMKFTKFTIHKIHKFTLCPLPFFKIGDIASTSMLPCP